MPTALVTGSTRGIGLDIAQKLISLGWDVTIVGRHATDDTLPGALAIQADLANPEDCARVAKAHLDRYGSIDLVANVAGIATKADLAAQSVEGWDMEFNINVRAMFLVTQQLLPSIIENQALVVNIGSISSFEGSKSMPAYCATKHAVLGFNRSLVKHLAGTGARSTVICPGYVATDMSSDAPLSLDEMIQPSDITNLVLMLLNLSPHAHIPELEIRRV